MQRRHFLRNSALLAASSAVSGFRIPQFYAPETSVEKDIFPVAITMWEFSWLERRWSGAGYEDWDNALDELTERGYNAIRIDAFPHFFYNDPEKEYILIPWWNTQDWGSPALNKVSLMPAFIEFIGKCAQRKIKIGLSSWYRQDEKNVRMKLDSPEKLGHAWEKVLDVIAAAGLLDTILYIDLCNEWTGPAWCPFFVNEPPEATWIGWHTQKSLNWMQQSIAILKKKYPFIPYTFSFTGEVTAENKNNATLNMLDFLELHIWMTSAYSGEFYKKVNYNYERFSDEGFKNIQVNGEKMYREKEEYWKMGLKNQILHASEWSIQSGLGLGTTECWGVVDYKDWPLLNWDWVKELCAFGTEEACKTGRWLAISTSNFCGPQFVGMWKDIEWHKRLTDLIKKSAINKNLTNTKLAKRILI